MDDYVRDVFNGEAQKRDAVSLESYHWPTRRIHYAFDPDIGNMHACVKDNMLCMTDKRSIRICRVKII